MRTSPAQEALPGDRSTRRRPGSGRSLLPGSRRGTAELLQAEADPDPPDAAAPPWAVCERTIWLLMNQAGIYGLPGPTRVKRRRGVATADDLVNRKFYRLRPHELWVTDITQHRTPKIPAQRFHHFCDGRVSALTHNARRSAPRGGSVRHGSGGPGGLIRGSALAGRHGPADGGAGLPRADAASKLTSPAQRTTSTCWRWAATLLVLNIYKPKMLTRYGW